MKYPTVYISKIYVNPAVIPIGLRITEKDEYAIHGFNGKAFYIDIGTDIDEIEAGSGEKVFHCPDGKPEGIPNCLTATVYADFLRSLGMEHEAMYVLASEPY